MLHLTLRRTTALPFVAALVAACGGAPPAPSSPAAPAPAVVETDEVVDLSPVPEPAGLVVVARVKDPNAIVATLGSWAKFPLPVGSALVRSLTDEQIADVVDLSQPVDFAASLDVARHRVEPLFAVSFSTGAFDAAKDKLGARYRLAPAANGAFRVIGLQGGASDLDDDEDEDDAGCVLAPAASGGRLVCGEGAGLDALTPYLSRTLPRESWASDIHVEIRPEPVRAPLTELRATIPVLARSMLGSQSPAVRDFVDASIVEIVDVVNDTQKLSFDATLEDDGLVVATRIDLRDRTSTFARVLTSAEPGPAPAGFFRVPVGTDTAWFVRGGDPTTFDGVRRLFSKLLVEAAGPSELTAADQSALEDLVGERTLRLFSSGTRVYAKGFDEAEVDKALAAKKSAKPDDLVAADAAEVALAEQVIGWHLFQVSEPIATVGPALKDWAQIMKRPGIAKWARSDAGAVGVRVAPIPQAYKLPKDSVHLEVTVPRSPLQIAAADATKAKPKATPRKPTTAHFYAVPDGDTTWIAFGLDGKLAAQKAAATLAAAPEASVTRQPALESDRLTSGGLFTLRGLAVLGMLGGRSGGGPFAILGATSNKGAAPIVLTATNEASAAGAEAGAFVGSLHLTRGAIEDIVKLATMAR